MLNRYVAIKVLKKEYREDENFVRKFRSEAQAAAGLQNPDSDTTRHPWLGSDKKGTIEWNGKTLKILSGKKILFEGTL